MPAQEALVHGAMLAGLSGARAVAAPHCPPIRTLAAPSAEREQIPRFLKR